MARLLETPYVPQDDPMASILDVIQTLMSGGKSRQVRYDEQAPARHAQRTKQWQAMDKAAAARRQTTGVPLYTQPGMHVINTIAPQTNQGIIDMIHVPQKRSTGLAVGKASKTPNVRVVG